jgi:type IV pilus assembly protein PilE
MVRQRGFSLVEIMIALVVVAILVAIALPSYKNYQIKVSRVAAQSEMIEIGAHLNQYLITQRSLLKDSSTTTGPLKFIPEHLPRHDTAAYSLSLDIPTASTWYLIATPLANTRQANNGILVLTSKGYRCWDKENKGVCGKDSSGVYKTTVTTNWDGR